MIITVTVAVAAILNVGLAMNRVKKADYELPEIIATETINGAQTKALQFGYSYYDGIEDDNIQTWKGNYTDENKLIVGGQISQYIIPLSVE